MKKSRFAEAQIMAALRQAEGGVPVPELCREHGISSASFYKWRAKYGGMDASMMSQMKALKDENRRLKRMYADLSMQADLLKEALGKNEAAISAPRELAEKAVAQRGVSIALACRTFGRYNRTARHEWLDQRIIESIEEAQEFATQWLWTHNNERPNMGIGGTETENGRVNSTTEPR